MEYLIYIGCFLLGLIVGWFVKKRVLTKPDAILGIDERDDEKDYYDFLFLIPIDEVPKRKNIMVEIQNKEK